MTFNELFSKILPLKFGFLRYSYYLYYVIKLKNMSTMLKNVKNPVEFNSYLYSEKVGYDSQNKMFLIRVYDYLVDSIENESKPTWTGIMRKMLGNNPKGLNPSSYYSSIRRCLKEIDVCTYDKSLGYFVKGSNWDRFVSDEDWSWFICRTGSSQYSEIVKP